MQPFPQDVFTEPEPDPHTLRNLGPLTPLAGIWEGQRGLDVHPAAEGTEKNAYIERIDLQPIDAQTNGPQLYYGLRYHTRIVKPDDVETFHDQVGYWLWEPATGTLLQTLAIPRGQIAMAVGTASPDAKSFELVARRGSEVNPQYPAQDRRADTESDSAGRFIAPCFAGLPKPYAVASSTTPLPDR